MVPDRELVGYATTPHLCFTGIPASQGIAVVSEQSQSFKALEIILRINPYHARMDAVGRLSGIVSSDIIAG